jgi:hypothetical protein
VNVCLIIDTCKIPSVFGAESQDHSDFIPVLIWITSPYRRGCIIYGGTKYKRELGKLHKYLPVIGELAKQRRAIELPGAPVDAYAAELKIRVPNRNFDDEHLVALVATSQLSRSLY